MIDLEWRLGKFTRKSAILSTATRPVPHELLEFTVHPTPAHYGLDESVALSTARARSLRISRTRVAVRYDSISNSSSTSNEPACALAASSFIRATSEEESLIDRNPLAISGYQLPAAPSMARSRISAS